MSTTEDWRAAMATHNANRHLALYLKTGNGLLIWQAYKELRDMGQPIPEALLKKFDLYASALLDAGSPNEALSALDLKNDKGGAWKQKSKRALERQRDIVEQIVALASARGVRLTSGKAIGQILSEVGESRPESLTHVRKVFNEWLRDDKKSERAATKTKTLAAHKEWR